MYFEDAYTHYASPKEAFDIKAIKHEEQQSNKTSLFCHGKDKLMKRTRVDGVPEEDCSSLLTRSS